MNCPAKRAMRVFLTQLGATSGVKQEAKRRAGGSDGKTHYRIGDFVRRGIAVSQFRQVGKAGGSTRIGSRLTDASLKFSVYNQRMAQRLPYAWHHTRIQPRSERSTMARRHRIEVSG